jgi:membrane glycosyltransferase
MLYYTQFVVMNLAGLQVRWTAQNRSDTGLGFLESFRIFWVPPVMGVIATTVLAIWAQEELWLLSPILAGWLIAAVLAWMTSQPKLGDWARRHRLFLIPEEIPELCPAELGFVEQAAAGSGTSLSSPYDALPVQSLTR